MDKNIAAPLGFALTLLVLIIIMVVVASPMGAAAPTRLVRTEEPKKASTQLAKIEPGSKYDKFFGSGLGYMSEMTTQSIEDEYMKYMAKSTGGGYYYMNPAQIKAEVSRLVDDRVTIGTEIQKKDRPAFDAKLGYINAAVDDGQVKAVKLNKA